MMHYPCMRQIFVMTWPIKSSSTCTTVSSSRILKTTNTITIMIIVTIIIIFTITTRLGPTCTTAMYILSNDHHHNQIGFYVYHSYILSSLGADSIPASIAPRCSYLIYKPDRREEVPNNDNDDEG